MKATVVPSQITTVEDKIMGNLGFSQLMLLISPVFLGAGLFALLPPFMAGSAYKYSLMGFIASLSCLLAIRIKGKIIARWLLVIMRYIRRPQFYVFNKNTSSFRHDEAGQTPVASLTPEPSTTTRARSPQLAFHETARVQTVIDNPATHLRFETTKKGALHVHLTQIEE